MSINLQLTAEVTLPQSTNENTSCKGRRNVTHHTVGNNDSGTGQPIHECLQFPLQRRIVEEVVTLRRTAAKLSFTISGQVQLGLVI